MVPHSHLLFVLHDNESLPLAPLQYLLACVPRPFGFSTPLRCFTREAFYLSSLHLVLTHFSSSFRKPWALYSLSLSLLVAQLFTLVSGLCSTTLSGLVQVFHFYNCLLSAAIAFGMSLSRPVSHLLEQLVFRPLFHVYTLPSGGWFFTFPLVSLRHFHYLLITIRLTLPFCL